jgi:hypothetical protein
MPPTPADCGSVRSAAVVNAEIRRLWERAPLSPGDVALYRELVVEWAAAARAERLRSEVSEAA